MLENACIGAVAAACAIGCGAVPAAPSGGVQRPEASIALAPGDAIELDIVNGHAGALLSTPTGSERFVAILASTRFDSGRSEYAYSMTQGHATPTAHRALTGCAIAPWRMAAAAPQPALDERPSSSIHVGARRTFSFRSHGTAEPVAARAIAVGASSVVWADESREHRAELDDPFVNDFLKDFETVILPRARSVFGRESDVDHDGRIALLFTPLTARSAVAFFSGCDLRKASECSGSNEAELLYLTPPNAIRPPYNTPRAMKEILAHELEHLIHYRGKVLAHGLADDPDAAYLLEGFGALAQDALGFQAGNLYVTMAGLEGIADVSLADIVVPGADYDRDRDGPLRGGAYLFVRWLYDRGGGDHVRADGGVEDAGGPSSIRALIEAGGPIASELVSHGRGGSLAEIAMDFFTALALSSRAAVGDAPPNDRCFAFLPTETDPVTGRQRGADLFARFHGLAMRGPQFREIGGGSAHLRGGGVEYVAVRAIAGARSLALSVDADPAALPRVRVARLR